MILLRHIFFVAFLLASGNAQAFVTGASAYDPSLYETKWKTDLYVDFQNSSREQVENLFSVSNNTSATYITQSVHRNEYGNTWFVDNDGLHMRVVADAIGQYTHKSAAIYFPRFYQNARVTLVGKVPATKTQGTNYAILWAWNGGLNNSYAEMDVMEVAETPATPENTGYINVHYGVSSSNKTSNSEIVALPWGEDVVYRGEWNNKDFIIMINEKMLRTTSRSIFYNDIQPLKEPMRVGIGLYCGVPSWIGNCTATAGNPHEMIIKSLRIEVPE